MLFIPSSDTAIEMVTHQTSHWFSPHLLLSNFGEPVGIVSFFFFLQQKRVALWLTGARAHGLLRQFHTDLSSNKRLQQGFI